MNDVNVTSRLWRAMTNRDIDALFDQGYVYVPFDQSNVYPALHEFEAFLSRTTEEEKARWCFAVDDPNDPDDGLIRKGGEGGTDHKYCFHWSWKLDDYLSSRGIVPTKRDVVFLNMAKLLAVSCQEIAYTVARGIDLSKRTHFSFFDAIREAEENPIPFSRPKLRFVQYDSQGSVRRARPHRDRGLLTVHIGGTGGEFYRCDDEHGTKKTIITPKEGEAIVFFGLKSEMLAGETCKALWHGSEVQEQDTIRFALVYFAHANLLLQNSWQHV